MSQTGISFAVGDYVIFKADGTGPTFTNTQYKILEFESKPFNFLDNEESAGLYFKIKVEDTADFNESSLDNYGWLGSGGNSIDWNLFGGNEFIEHPVRGSFSIRGDKTIFYGEGDQNSLTTNLLPLNAFENSDTNAALYLNHDKKIYDRDTGYRSCGL